MRLKDVDALKAKIRQEMRALEPGMANTEAKRLTFQKVLLLIKELPIIEPPQWISCAERLPDGECIALSMIEGHSYKEKLVGYVYEDAESETGYSCEDDAHILMNVTHWMQPELPKMDER